MHDIFDDNFDRSIPYRSSSHFKAKLVEHLVKLTLCTQICRCKHSAFLTKERVLQFLTLRHNQSCWQTDSWIICTNKTQHLNMVGKSPGEVHLWQKVVQSSLLFLILSDLSQISCSVSKIYWCWQRQRIMDEMSFIHQPQKRKGCLSWCSEWTERFVDSS